MGLETLIRAMVIELRLLRLGSFMAVEKCIKANKINFITFLILFWANSSKMSEFCKFIFLFHLLWCLFYLRSTMCKIKVQEINSIFICLYLNLLTLAMSYDWWNLFRFFYLFGLGSIFLLGIWNIVLSVLIKCERICGVSRWDKFSLYVFLVNISLNFIKIGAGFWFSLCLQMYRLAASGLLSQNLLS